MCIRDRVDNHTIAGAVILVATRDHAAYLEPVGFSDLATKTPMRGRAILDCLGLQAHHRRGAYAACR